MTFTVAAQTWKYVNFGTTRFGRGSNAVGSSTYTAQYSFGLGNSSIYSNVYMISDTTAMQIQKDTVEWYAPILKGYDTEYKYYRFTFNKTGCSIYPVTDKDSLDNSNALNVYYDSNRYVTVVILKYPCKIPYNGVGSLRFIYGPNPSNIINFSK